MDDFTVPGFSMNRGRSEANGLQIQPPHHDESLASVDSVVGVVEDVSAQQCPAAAGVASDPEASKGDRAVKKLHLRAAAGIGGHAVGELATAEIAVPEDSGQHREQQKYKNCPRRPHPPRSLAAGRLSPTSVRYHVAMPAAQTPDWSLIDTVLLDMDGTLLDLSFDNHFWLDLVPRHYAMLNGLGIVEAKARLKPKFRAAEGTLDWYSVEHWSRELGFDVMAIKHDARERVCFQPGAEQFLDRLTALGKRRVLLTNAYPRALAIKDAQVGLTGRFDALYSTHPFKLPKEHLQFWPRFHAREPFDPTRTLVADDSLPVLRAAHAFGVRWLRAILRPDSTQPARVVAEFAGVDYVAELL